LVSPSFSQDFKESNFPGGYIGLGFQYGTSKTIGVQLSFGAVVPSVGAPAVGPYLFPALVTGWKKSLMNKNSYSYVDLQATLFGGIYGGLGIGYAFSEHGNFFRYKQYAGFLILGITRELPFQSKLKDDYKFTGAHLGLTYPIPGNHLYP